MARTTKASTGPRVEIRGSRRDEPKAARIGRVPPEQPIDVQVYLRCAPAPDLAKKALDDQPALAARISRADLRDARAESLKKPFRTIERFAAANDLHVTGHDPARRMIALTGTAVAMEAAFGTKLYNYREDETEFQARSGALFATRAVVRIVDSVLGFTLRPIVQPLLGSLSPLRPEGGRLPNAFASFYNFPATPGHGAGQRIALLQFGGTYHPADTVQAFQEMGLAVPKISLLSIAGGMQTPDPVMSKEIALDVQVAGGLAPGAEILLYFGPHGNRGFVDTLSQAIHDPVNRPTIISISFGTVEEEWSSDVVRTMNGVLRDAANLGITVIAATGDMLATCAYGDGRGHVFYPASDPYVLACGGTAIAQADGETREVVWNVNGWGTGGGVSALWSRPAYQDNVPVPAFGNGKTKKRGVPDVCAVADPTEGYRICCNGRWSVEGGTSAVAPLWAALIARINEQKGSSIGFANPRLYALPQAFNDVLTGDNREAGIGYAAGPGWDACTGLGSPDGVALLQNMP